MSLVNRTFDLCKGKKQEVKKNKKRHTQQNTDRPHDIETESAQWADSVKISKTLEQTSLIVSLKLCLRLKNQIKRHQKTTQDIPWETIPPRANFTNNKKNHAFPTPL